MKKGISLIVLVITIIVMIILAASVVISLSNTGIIEKATQAVNLSNEVQVQDMRIKIMAQSYHNDDRAILFLQMVSVASILQQLLFHSVQRLFLPDFLNLWRSLSHVLFLFLIYFVQLGTDCF